MISGNIPYDFKEHEKLHAQLTENYLDASIAYNAEQKPASRREKIVDEAVFEPVIEE